MQESTGPPGAGIRRDSLAMVAHASDFSTPYPAFLAKVSYGNTQITSPLTHPVIAHG